MTAWCLKVAAVGWWCRVAGVHTVNSGKHAKLAVPPLLEIYYLKDISLSHSLYYNIKKHNIHVPGCKNSKISEGWVRSE